MPSLSLPSTVESIKLSRVDLLWITIGALVPTALATLNYYHRPTGDAQLLVTAALILGAFTLITTRLRAMERSLENFYRSADRRASATTELTAAALSGEEMEDCRRLFAIVNTVRAFNNPLMTALAQTQLRGLAEFLEKFNKRLPFFPDHELITIDTHYLSFMKRMANRGSYEATTFVQFWMEQDEEILRDFFHNNEVAANDGVTIRRVFLISPTDAQKPNTFAILQAHSRISSVGGYQNGGSITTRVLPSDTFSRNQDDFGIYILDDKPMAIAIAKFDLAGDRLRGNDVSFDEDFMRRKRQLFESRWQKAEDIHDYLKRSSTFDAKPDTATGTVKAST